MMRRPREAAAAAALALTLLAGCVMTPDEIRAVEIENELLREQIQALREKCQQGRELELKPEPGGIDEDD
jgi:hypothetical protein